jgi:hypothetical protein
MLGPIVVYVTRLAEGGEVLGPVVRRVMIAAPGRQNHTCYSYGTQNVICPNHQAVEASYPIPPGARLSIPPASIAEIKDALSMRTGADIATSLGLLEADRSRELGPIDGIEEAVLAPDRYQEDARRVAAAARSAWLRVRA